MTTKTAATTLFTEAKRFADLDDWRREALELHAAGPVHRIEQPGFRPFWAVIGHDEVMSAERRPTELTNGPLPVLTHNDILAVGEAGGGVEMRTLIHMDAPDHGAYRKMTNDWFKPASVRSLAPRLDELSERALDTMRASGGELDFYRDVAIQYPLQVILAILGLPEDDYGRMLQLTQELFGAEDPDLRREEMTPERAGEVILDFYQYFTALTADRMATPTDDLATLIANGTIDGEPIPDLDKLSYYVIIATAGHDTTAAAMAGGMRALAEHPDQLRLLQEDPSLLANAVDEMIRWTSPVRHFMRTAQNDLRIGDVDVAEGDWVYLSYLAANLDPEVFTEPLRFDITRPNADRHIAFGYGVHFCLGAQLARMELRSLFGRLVPELESLELAGEPATTQATFVGGHKRVPIRFRLR
ncbi:MAG: cytochrome P450 [Actinomycetota bacterium]|nr:cytochrome P450 [Actinomycetota bacterium]